MKIKVKYDGIRTLNNDPELYDMEMASWFFEFNSESEAKKFYEKEPKAWFKANSATKPLNDLFLNPNKKALHWMKGRGKEVWRISLLVDNQVLKSRENSNYEWHQEFEWFDPYEYQ